MVHTKYVPKPIIVKVLKSFVTQNFSKMNIYNSLMRDIYHEIDDFLENLDIVGPSLSFDQLKELVHPLSHILPKVFDEHRLAVLIYLGKNYLTPDNREQWLRYYQIYLVDKLFLSHTGVKKSLSLLVDHEEPEPTGSDDDSECADIAFGDPESQILEKSESQILEKSESKIPETSDLAVTESTIPSQISDPVLNLIDFDEEIHIPTKIVPIEVPTARHDSDKTVCQTYDEDFDLYLSVHRLEPDIVRKIYEKNLSPDLITSLGYTEEYIKKRLDFYRNIPQVPQKSTAWLDQRSNCITASALSSALGHNGASARNTLLKEKVSRGTYRSFIGNINTRWGEKYEDLASAIYCYRLGKLTGQPVEVFDFGLLPHTQYPMLGASTDGVNNSLINLELKCPPTRKITGDVPTHYWAQIQLQLEVLDLPLSHFLECRLEEFDSSVDFYQSFSDQNLESSDKFERSVKSQNLEPNPEKGITLEIIDMSRVNDGLPSRTHRHSPVELYDKPEELKEWHRTQIREILSDKNYVLGIESYWFLSKYSCVNVQRDFKWFRAQLSGIFSFWSDVEKYRDLGFDALVQQIEREKTMSSDRNNIINLDDELINETCLLDDETTIAPPITNIPLERTTILREQNVPMERKTIPNKTNSKKYKPPVKNQTQYQFKQRATPVKKTGTVTKRQAIVSFDLV